MNTAEIREQNEKHRPTTFAKVRALCDALDEARAQVETERLLKDSARGHWQEAQNRLADVERTLNEITGNSCGIDDNLDYLRQSNGR